MDTNVKKFRYSVWFKAICIVLSVLLSAALGGGIVLSALGMSFEFSENEEDFFNSSQTVSTLCSRISGFVEMSLIDRNNDTLHDEIMSQKSDATAAVLEKYQACEKEYKEYLNKNGYEDSGYEADYFEDEQGNEETTRYYYNENADYENKYLEASVETQRGEFVFQIRFLDIYYRDGYTARELIESAYDDFADESAFQYHSSDAYSTANALAYSLSQGIWLDGEVIGYTNDTETPMSSQLENALDNGYFFIYKDGEITADEKAFSHKTVEKLTAAIEKALGGEDGVTYLLCINTDNLYAAAKDDYINYAAIFTVPSDELLNEWVFNELHINNSVVRALTTSPKQSGLILGAVFLALGAVMILYLTSAGKKEKDGEVRLCFKDYIPVEIHFIIDFIIGCIPFALLFDAGKSFCGGSLYYPVTACAASGIGALLVLDFTGSLVRAIKSERKTSKFFVVSLLFILVKKGFEGIKRALTYKPKCFERNVIIMLLAYIFANAFLVALTGILLNFGGAGAFLGVLTFLLWLGGNIAVIYYVGDYVKKLDNVIICAINKTDVQDIDSLYQSLKYLASSNKYINIELQRAVEKAVKDERLRSELITNVSHDLKTPLTSIITYVDLLSKCDIDDESAKKYIAVLDEKGKRLKRLIDDLIEASKVTSGAITINPTRLNLYELCVQSTVDAQEGFEKQELELVVKECSEPVEVVADGAKAFRVIENLLSNARKYSARGSRVYVSVYNEGDFGVFEIKNISEKPLDIDPEELTQRFVRGDKSRSEDGNGLGLSIAKELCRAQNGRLEIIIDGDLFKARVLLPAVPKQ